MPLGTVSGLQYCPNLLKRNAAFVLGDKPGRHEHLIVQIDAGRQDLAGLKVLEKRRNLAGTPIFLNCYLADSARLQGSDNKVIVDQLYIIDDLTALL